MEKEKIMSSLLDSIPYPILFVDRDHIIRYLNRAARYQYYSERGYTELIGKSLFDCHNDGSKEKIIASFEKMKNNGKEIYLGVSVKNHRIYMNPVRDENGDLIGYFERFELNLQKD